MMHSLDNFFFLKKKILITCYVNESKITTINYHRTICPCMDNLSSLQEITIKMIITFFILLLKK